MLKNIVERKPIQITERYIDFQDNDTWGYRFDADENGNVILENDAQRANYEYALAHPEKFPARSGHRTEGQKCKIQKPHCPGGWYRHCAAAAAAPGEASDHSGRCGSRN